MSPLHVVARGGDKAMAKRLLDNGKLDRLLCTLSACIRGPLHACDARNTERSSRRTTGHCRR